MKRKVLLMGRSGSGKTSMRSIIFANYVARDTMRLGPTLGVEHSHVRILGALTLNLWDCGGQDAFMENYYASQRSTIFRNVEVLIYVIDAETTDRAGDIEQFVNCLDAIKEFSKNAHVFVLVHKMDLLPREERTRFFEARSAELLQLADPLKLTCFATSIWDETLYKAWSSIVIALLPNTRKLERQLGNFCKIANADEVVLFEKATFLVLSHAMIGEQPDPHRFEKISNIVKQFKLSCSKAQATFESMEVRHSGFTAFIRAFTSHTFILVVMPNPEIQPAATLLNIEAAKEYFEGVVSRHVS